MLGEMMQVLTGDMVNAGETAPGKNLSQLLRSKGFTDTQVDARRVVVVRYQIYWNNRSSGSKYSQQDLELVADGVAVEPGNVVELQLEDRGRGVIHRVGRPTWQKAPATTAMCRRSVPPLRCWAH